jgi:hypothetical protein
MLYLGPINILFFYVLIYLLKNVSFPNNIDKSTDSQQDNIFNPMNKPYMHRRIT